MEFLYLIFYACLRFRFLDVETNPGQRRPVSDVCRILCNNMLGLARASSQYEILLCSETLVFDMRHVSELLVNGFGRLFFLCRARCLVPEGWLHTFEMVTEYFANPNLSMVVCEMFVLGICGVRQNLCVQSLVQP